MENIIIKKGPHEKYNIILKRENNHEKTNRSR
jgi:hypothetical protein